MSFCSFTFFFFFRILGRAQIMGAPVGLGHLSLLVCMVRGGKENGCGRRKVFFFLFIYLWLRWVLVSARGPSPAAASGGLSSSRCAGVSPSRPLLLRSTGSRCSGSVAVAHGPSCSAACGIFPDQGLNPRSLH